MTTLRHERTYGDLENPMTTNGQTVQNPECSCPSGAAIAAGFDVPHKTECYIELAKEAEAVQGVPVRQVGTQPVNPPAPADDLYAPEPTPQRRRTAVPLPPASEMEYTRIDWVEGLPVAQITELHATGVPAMIKAGTIIGKLTNKRDFEGQNGMMYFGDITIESENPELHGIGASFTMPTILKALMDQVALDSNVEIVRKGKIGKAFGFEVYVLD